MSEIEKAFEAGTNWKEKYSKIVDDDMKVPDFKKFALENNIGTCKWKKINIGNYKFSSYDWQTECGKSYDADNVAKENYCPNCGHIIV